MPTHLRALTQTSPGCTKRLVEIAQSDGNVISNEKGSINSLAEYFGVENPF